MADTFEAMAARTIDAVRDAYAGTLLGYAADLGYGAPEFAAAERAAADAVRRIADKSRRADVMQAARMIAADLLQRGTHTPSHAGREAARRAWLLESHGAESDAVPAAPDTLLELESHGEFVNVRPQAADHDYRTLPRDLMAYALESLPALEFALVTAYAAVDGWQASRFPTAALVRHLMAYAPHVARELGLTDGLPTGRRAVKFADAVRVALQLFADAYADTLHHDTHDARRRCSRPAPLLYVLPERTGSATRVPTFADTPGPALRTGYVTVPASKRGTMAPWRYRAGASREQRAADHAAFSDACGSAARAVPGVRAGTLSGHGIAGSGTAQRVQASRRRKRDGGIGSPMTRA